MKKVDFISGAPKTFIFQKNSNKTNLGGILTVIFIIATLLIIISYIYEYYANEKYVVSYFYNEVYYNDNERIEKYNNKKYYPDLTYHLVLEQFNGGDNIIKDIKIADGDFKEIPLKEKRVTSVSNLTFIVLYKCKNESDCSLREEDNDTISPNIFSLDIIYDGYFCDHQNPKSPIKNGESYKFFPFTIEDHIDYYYFDWKIIQYKEEKSFSGMFRSTEETNGGVFINREKFSIPSEKLNYLNITNEETGEMEYYKIIAVMQFFRDNYGYFDNYSRVKITLWDSIANICALVSTLYGVVTFIFCGFYSNSFDNYKIIEKIISRSSYLSIKNIKDMKNVPPKEDIELTDQIESDKGETLLEIDEDKDDKKIITDKKMIDDNINIEKYYNLKPLFKMPKFHFYDFLYNNIYSDCCKPSSTQGIISACNDLISKYYSIDAVVYNQLRLDNLYKEYKWNNPKLNDIGNNDLIFQIKSLSENLPGN